MTWKISNSKCLWNLFGWNTKTFR